MFTRTTSKITYNLESLLPKSKLTFRNLKKRAQELQRKFILAPTDTDANKDVVVLKTRYIDTQKHELSTANAYEYHSCLMRGLSLLGIGVIWLQTLVCLMMRIMLNCLPKFHKKIL